MPELTGILKGTGAKMKADIHDTHVVFRGQAKGTVPFSQLSAEARGTLLVIQWGDRVVEVSAGGKAAAYAKKINLG